VAEAKTQRFENHRRIRPIYHYFLSPLGIGLAGWATYELIMDFSGESIFRALTALALMVVIFLVRIHALENQNRIIRMEMRYRYNMLTGKRLEPLERELGLGRIIALRFAGDEELPELLELALKEKLSPDEIKRRITNWQGDFYRV
jgi:hypothetical protein